MKGAGYTLPNANDELQKIRFILQENADKDFVQRIQYPQEYPTLDLGDGTHGTHLMMWGEHQGIPIAYPSIIHEKGKLNKLDPKRAYDHAIKTGEFITFTDSKDADWFSKNYKRVWDRK